jgi:hypothetical protein
LRRLAEDRLRSETEVLGIHQNDKIAVDAHGVADRRLRIAAISTCSTACGSLPGSAAMSAAPRGGQFSQASVALRRSPLQKTSPL